MSVVLVGAQAYRQSDETFRKFTNEQKSRFNPFSLTNNSTSNDDNGSDSTTVNAGLYIGLAITLFGLGMILAVFYYFFVVRNSNMPDIAHDTHKQRGKIV